MLLLGAFRRRSWNKSGVASQCVYHKLSLDPMGFPVSPVLGTVASKL